MLKQEHAVLAGEIARVEIEDPYLKVIEEEKAAEAKRKRTQREVDEECCPVVLHPDLREETAEAIIETFKDAKYEILQDTVIKLDIDMASELLADEIDEPDYASRINKLMRDPLRVLIVARGSEGVFNEFAKFIGPKSSEGPLEDENFESIRDKFGGGKPNSCLTVPKTSATAEKAIKMLYPEFTPRRVIVYVPDTEEIRPSVHPMEEKKDSLMDDEITEGSSGVPEYQGPPRVIVLVKPPAYGSYRHAVITDLEANGFEVLSTKDYTFTEEEAREYYADLASLSLFEGLIAVMTSGPSFIIMACKDDGPRALKDILGPESYAQALKDSPDSLRGKYSSLPEILKEDDLTWIDGTIAEPQAQNTVIHFFPVEETFALLKPDSQPAWDEILDDIKRASFKIAAKKEVQLLPEDVRVIYEREVDKPYFDDLVRHMTSGRSLALILKAQDAVKKWAKLIGPTDPDVAVDSYPPYVKPEDACLRATYGRNIRDNAVHGSSSVEEAKKSIRLIFSSGSHDSDGSCFIEEEEDEDDDDFCNEKQREDENEEEYEERMSHCEKRRRCHEKRRARLTLEETEEEEEEENAEEEEERQIYEKEEKTEKEHGKVVEKPKGKKRGKSEGSHSKSGKSKTVSGVVEEMEHNEEEEVKQVTDEIVEETQPPTTIEEVKEDTDMRATVEDDGTTITSLPPQELQETTEATEEANVEEANPNNQTRPRRRVKKRLRKLK
ncbi:thioredoxin domain containing protein 3 [Echinococcus multilocularis]|uniref:Thioredoxin domain containing protein 3 n=1 Tax=Echinococcus multilocularis TaxID=6211 RepID=A0A068Y8L8_ECHMU|nr:thioredoxin domain containing protein 3 [Echinococcus multilocularis]